MALSEREKLLTLEADQRATLRKILPLGSLIARRLRNDEILFLWRCKVTNFKEEVEKIGFWDKKMPPKAIRPSEHGCYTIEGAAQRAQEIARIAYLNYQQGFDGYRYHLYKQDVELQKQEENPRYSLQALLDNYVDYLEKQGKTDEAKGIFKNHVSTCVSGIAQKLASLVTAEDVTELIRGVTEKGIHRTANKLRSYLRTAFQLAVDAPYSPSIPAVFKDFEISVNPVDKTKPDARGKQSAKDPLSKDELRRYWGLLQGVNGLKGQVLRIHLLTGGQRIEQLVRLKFKDVHSDYIRLIDLKGKGGNQRREIIIPLIDLVKRDLPSTQQREYVFTTDGVTHLSNHTISKWAKEVVNDEITGFQLKRVRSGIETLLASQGVGKDIRGHLQSHGIGGVQDRHYDGHDYFKEKKAALEVVLREITN